MTPNERLALRMSRLGTPSIRYALAALVLLLIITGCSKNLDSIFPKEIRDVKLGSTKADVSGLLKNSGKMSEEPVPKRADRIRLRWIPDSDPNFDSVAFDFTELKRLYAIRFLLKRQRENQARNIRDFLLQKYNIPSDFPGKVRQMDVDGVLYAGRDQVHVSLFVFTNVVSGRKTFEVFDRQISGTDFRQAVEKKSKGQARKKSPKPKPTVLTPEDQAGWGEPKPKPETSPK